MGLKEMKLGHSYVGCAVDDRNAELATTGEVLQCLFDTVKYYMNEYSVINNNAQCNIAFLSSTEDVSLIFNYLTKSGITTKTISESLSDKDSTRYWLVLDSYEEALSYEFPIVIKVELSMPTKLSDQSLLCVGPRTISQLIVIGRNIDAVYCIALERYNSMSEQEWSLNTFVDMIGNIAKELGEKHGAVTIQHLDYTILHLNYFPHLNMRHCADSRVTQCHNLSDYMKLMIEDKNHMAAAIIVNGIAHIMPSQIGSFAVSKVLLQTIPFEIANVIDDFMAAFHAQLLSLEDEASFTNAINHAKKITDELIACEPMFAILWQSIHYLFGNQSPSNYGGNVPEEFSSFPSTQIFGMTSSLSFECLISTQCILPALTFASARYTRLLARNSWILDEDYDPTYMANNSAQSTDGSKQETLLITDEMKQVYMADSLPLQQFIVQWFQNIDYESLLQSPENLNYYESLLRDNLNFGKLFDNPNLGKLFDNPNLGKLFDNPNLGKLFDNPNLGKLFDNPNFSILIENLLQQFAKQELADGSDNDEPSTSGQKVVRQLSLD